MNADTEYKRAQGVATRRNNAARRKLPLFADQMPVVTAEEVIEKRQVAREATPPGDRVSMRCKPAISPSVVPGLPHL